MMAVILVIAGGLLAMYFYTLLFTAGMDAERAAGTKEERERCIRIINERRAACPKEYSQWLLELIRMIQDGGR